MNRKTKNTLKFLAVIIVLVCVLMQMGYIAIPALAAYKFWLVVIAFAMSLLAG